MLSLLHIVVTRIWSVGAIGWFSLSVNHLDDRSVVQALQKLGVARNAADFHLLSNFRQPFLAEGEEQTVARGMFFRKDFF